MSSIPYLKSTRDEEKEDDERHERYAKGFIAMTTITSFFAVIIVVACFLYRAASCDTGSAPLSAGTTTTIFFKLACKLIGSEYDPDNPGFLGCILFSLAFGWFVILSMFLLDTRPMMDLFNSTQALQLIKLYLVYPFLVVIGIVLILGIISFIPSFGIYRFVDQKTGKPSSSESLPFSDSDSIITKIVRRLKLTLPFRRLHSNFLNLLLFSTTISKLGAAALAIAAFIVGAIYLSKKFTDGITDVFKIILIVIGVLVATAVMISVYDSAAKKEKEYEGSNPNSIILLIIKVFRYIPCLIIDGVNWIRHELNITTRPVWILLLLEAVVIGGYFLIPLILNSTIFSGSTELTQNIVDISTATQLQTMENVGIVRTPECSTKLKTKHSYAISGWMFFSSHPPSMTKGGSQFVNVLDFNGVPRIEYNSSTNELRFQIKVRAPSKSTTGSSILTETDKTTIEDTAMSLSDIAARSDRDESTESFETMISGSGSGSGSRASQLNDSFNSGISGFNSSISQGIADTTDKGKGIAGWAKAVLPKSSIMAVKTRAPPEESVMITIYTMTNVPLQKWNHFVYNYDGTNIDIFMNNKLVTSVTNRLPLIEHGHIVSGASRGVIGNLTHVVAFSNHLTKDVITSIYTKEDPRGLLWSTYSNTRVPELMHTV
jgi:hypothetical protein